MLKPLNMISLSVCLALASCSHTTDKAYLETTIFDQKTHAENEIDIPFLSPSEQQRQFVERAIIDRAIDDGNLKLPRWQKPILYCGIKKPATLKNGVYTPEHTHCVTMVKSGYPRDINVLLPRTEHK